MTNLEITACNANDSPYLSVLAQSTAKRIDNAELYADIDYNSHQDREETENVGAVPCMPLKVNSEAVRAKPWRRLFGYCRCIRDRFLKRSNVEITFTRSTTSSGKRYPRYK